MKSISSLPGASVFRSVCSIVLILILIAILLYTIDDFNQQAAKITHDSVINELNIALSFHLYQAAIGGKLNELPNLHEANPFKVLSGENYRPPKDYVREVDSESELNQPGWYFNADSKVIYYWDEVNLTQSYQLQYVHNDLNQAGRVEAGTGNIEKLEMVLIK